MVLLLCDDVRVGKNKKKDSATAAFLGMIGTCSKPVARSTKRSVGSFDIDWTTGPSYYVTTGFISTKRTVRSRSGFGLIWRSSRILESSPRNWRASIRRRRSSGIDLWYAGGGGDSNFFHKQHSTHTTKNQMAFILFIWERGAFDIFLKSKNKSEKKKRNHLNRRSTNVRERSAGHMWISSSKKIRFKH